MIRFSCAWVGAFAVVVAAGCGSSTPPADAGPPVACADGSAPGDAAVAPGSTLDFVMSALTIDSRGGLITDDPTVPHTGFNLDGLYSNIVNDTAGCYREDYAPLYDADQALTNGCQGTACGGVDNLLPTFALVVQAITPDFDVNATMARSIARGERLIVLRLTGVDDLFNDPEAELSVFMAFDADAQCDNNFTGAGRLTLDARSFAGGDPTRPLWHARAAIVGGRVRTLEPFTTPVPIPLTLHRFVEADGHASQLRFDLASCGATARGNWGAWVEVGPLVAQASIDEPATAQAIAQVATALVDIQVQGVCVDNTGPTLAYGGASVGYGFELAPVTLVGVSSAPPAGACSAP